MTKEEIETRVLLSRPIHSLDDIRFHREILKAQLQESDEKLADIWDSIFHAEEKDGDDTPTQKVLNIAAKSAGVVDGAIFAWKMYKRFGNAFDFLPWKKKKKKK